MNITPTVFWLVTLFVSALCGRVVADRTRSAYTGNLTRIVNSNEVEAELYTELIGILEKLDILLIKASSCHRLDKIVRHIQDINRIDLTRDVAVTFYFQESLLNKSQVLASNRYRQSQKLKAVTECQKEPSVINDAHSLLKDRENLSTTTMSNNTTLGILAVNVNDDSEDDATGMFGLSHTQVVVISTCSAIIGTFFFVAAIMRIRNYVKRLQAEQNVQRRETFRSCNFTLANNNSPARDSNKPSPKDSYTVRMPKANSSGKISSNGSRTLSDTKPLLTVNPVPKPPTIPSKLSDNSLMYIDEDAKTIKTPETEDNPPLVVEVIPVNTEQPPVKAILIKNNSNKSFRLETTRGWTFDQEITEAGHQGLIRANSSFDDTRSLSRGNSMNKSSEEQQNSVNDTKSLPFINFTPIAEELPSPQLVEYSNFGLTQSDNSISSMNHDYSYGNQMEYHNKPLLFRGKNSSGTSVEASSPGHFQELKTGIKDSVIVSPNNQQISTISSVKHSNDITIPRQQSDCVTAENKSANISVGTSAITSSANSSSADNPANSSSADNPANNSSADNSANSSSADKQSSVDNPANSSSADIPANISSADNSANNFSADNSANSSSANNPANKSSADNQTDKSSADNPAKTSSAENQANKSSADNAANKSSVDNPANNSSADNSANSSSADNPANSSSADNQSSADIQANNSSADNPANYSSADNSSNKSSADNLANKSSADIQSSADNPANSSSADNPANKASVDNPANKFSADNPVNSASTDNQSSADNPANSADEQSSALMDKLNTQDTQSLSSLNPDSKTNPKHKRSLQRLLSFDEEEKATFL